MGLSKWIPMFVLRLIALGATVSAALIMVTSRDTAQVLNVKFEAKYTNSPTFKYFVLMNAIASVYTFIMMFLPLKSSYRHLILVLDLIMTLLLDSSISSCIAIGQVGKKGNSYAGWLPICGQVPKFCDHVTGALIAGFVAAIIYFLILLYSLHNVINLFTLKN
ncbi:CASP-like protein RCOM_1174750 [Striga asiatica]|uniref:CASP-like protein n=1 Tax=Striga asiatica TaxID=4170 RepID=A0A5A7PFW2_STRAF|nr:CASP-like protein RCOM_1174750 [Striga asiatica]